jgi:co-chaperonin GroES (HSP10)
VKAVKRTTATARGIVASSEKQSAAEVSVVVAAAAAKASPQRSAMKLHESVRAASPRVALGAISNRA